MSVVRVEHKIAISFFNTWGQQGVCGSASQYSQHRRQGDYVITHDLLTFWNVIDFFCLNLRRITVTVIWK